MWDGGVITGWKEGEDAFGKGGVMSGWGLGCGRGAPCHKDYVGAPRDKWAAWWYFFFFCVTAHNRCR